MTTVAELLRWAETTLADADSELVCSCKVDAQWLLALALDKSITWLYTWPDAKVSEEQQQSFRAFITRRSEGEPVAYITGQQGFWSLDLKVTDATLIPRPDTELLVETALSVFDAQPIDVVDLGTGTGAIALALHKERPEWRMTATDISSASLDVARHNVQRNPVRNGVPVQFMESSWFEQLSGQRFHLIVSNPPYIEKNDPHLQGIGVRYEPLTALASGDDGLDDVRQIIAQAPDYLQVQGWLILEHGFDQADAVQALLHDRGFNGVQSYQDFGKNDRITVAQWLGVQRGESDHDE